YAAIKIKELNVPNSIEFGSTNEIILDCNYEANEETDLELKWYYNGETDIIYQWIPDQQKFGSAMGSFKDHIDLEYYVSNEANDTDIMYRALKIKNITPDLTGNYTCKMPDLFHSYSKVASPELVFEALLFAHFSGWLPPAKSGLDIILIQEEVVCTAHGLFPKPAINIYITGENDTKTEIKETTTADEDMNGLYNITTTHVFGNLTNFTNPTKFICELSIPGTDYYLSKSVEYYKGNWFITILT
ncbi:hypothetical protein NQ314_007027, partial [Rhamnusium bicolor]